MGKKLFHILCQLVGQEETEGGATGRGADFQAGYRPLADFDGLTERTKGILDEPGKIGFVADDHDALEIRVGGEFLKCGFRSHPA